MLFNQIPYYLFHEINSFLTNCEILKMSQICKRFNLMLKNERYFKYINCKFCISKYQANKLGHLGCFNNLIKTDFLVNLYDKNLYQEMHIHFIEFIIVKDKQFLTDKNWYGSSFEFVINNFIRFGNLECLKYLITMAPYKFESLKDFQILRGLYGEAKRWNQFLCSEFIREYHTLTYNKKVGKIRGRKPILNYFE